MIGIIAAVSANGVIGIDNKLPFHYPEDLRHFKEMTLNSTVIMGRNTFESLGKPLKNRKNMVISSRQIEEIETYSSIKNALDNCKDEELIWFIGGAKVYEEAMSFADKIYLTLTPDVIYHPHAIKFPWINPLEFNKLKIENFNNSSLKLCIYTR